LPRVIADLFGWAQSEKPAPTAGLARANEIRSAALKTVGYPAQ
jgi:hypothetical protein